MNLDNCLVYKSNNNPKFDYTYLYVSGTEWLNHYSNETYNEYKRRTFNSSISINNLTVTDNDIAKKYIELCMNDYFDVKYPKLYYEKYLINNQFHWVYYDTFIVNKIKYNYEINIGYHFRDNKWYLSYQITLLDINVDNCSKVLMTIKSSLCNKLDDSLNRDVKSICNMMEFSKSMVNNGINESFFSNDKLMNNLLEYI